MSKNVKVGKWFYYPHDGKWYRFIDERNAAGELTSRVCEQSDTKPAEA